MNELFLSSCNDSYFERGGMMGFLIIPALVLYGLFSLGMVLWVIVHAIRRGKNPWIWGFCAAFLMYNLVFWDWLPTVAVHKYYCSTEAGFWVYKTPEEWKVENPSLLKGSKIFNKNSSNRSMDEVEVQRYLVNKNVVWQRSISNVTLNVRRYEDKLIDANNEEILAKRIFFESGKCFGTSKKISDIKFWLRICDCKTNDDSHYDSKFSWSGVYNKFKTMGEN